MFDPMVIGRAAQMLVHGGPVDYAVDGGQGVRLRAIYDPTYIQVDPNGGFGNQIQTPKRRLLISMDDLEPKDGDLVTIVPVVGRYQPDEGKTFEVRAPNDGGMGMWAMTLETPDGSEPRW